MTTGTLQSACIVPASGGINSGVYDGRTISTYPFGARLCLDSLLGALTFHEPSIPSFSETGSQQGAFFFDWYNRIHLTPTLLALGNVVSNVTKSVKVWNAWQNLTQTLNSITATGGGGITYSGPSSGALPLVFQRNQELTWIFTVSESGPPTINATYDYLFADSESVVLDVTGNRITAWALTPDWAGGVRETLQFKTDVMTAWSGVEMRRSLRIAPRRSFDFESPMQKQERQTIEASLFAWSAMIWALPIFSDGQRLSSSVSSGAMSIPADTVNRDFVANGLAILIRDAANYEVLQLGAVSSSALSLINPVGNNWAAGSRLYPVRSCRLSGYPKITRINGQMSSIKPSFITVEPCDFAPASGLPTYRSYPVLEDSPDDAANASDGYEREARLIDNQTGAVEIDDTAQIGFPTTMHSWFMNGRTARAAFRSLMYLLKGRWAEIWVPSYQSDLNLTAAITSGGTNLQVVSCGYTLFLANQLNRQDIRIELYSGAVFYRRVTGSVVLDPNNELLSISSNTGQDIAINQVRRISFMALCRLNSDSIDIMHVNGDNGLAQSATQFRATNHNV